MTEYYDVVLEGSDIPLNRVFIYDIIKACEFVLRQEAEDKRRGVYEPGAYRVVRRTM